MHTLMLQLTSAFPANSLDVPMIGHLLQNVASSIFAAPPPPPIDPSGLIETLTSFVLKILMAIAGLWVVIDMFKHVTASPRDLKTAGIELVLMGAMIAVASKSEVIINWAKGAL